MPTYIMLTSMTSEGSQRLHSEPDRLNEVNEEVAELGCRVVTQYATLGPYDFVTVIEAPDNETIAVLSAGLSSRGTISVLTMAAMPTADFLGRLKAHTNFGKR
jgi:uncharacterized protein with GYD domain